MNAAKSLFSSLFSPIMALILVSGCSNPKTVFVVLRDVPESPSFVVIPANDYLVQVDFANEIEADLIACGVKVVARPAMKEVQTTKQGAQLDTQVGQAAGATLIEKYMALEETNADYFISAFADTRQIKIIKRPTREVISVLDLSGTASNTSSKLVREALTNLGIVKPTYSQYSGTSQRRTSIPLDSVYFKNGFVATGFIIGEGDIKGIQSITITTVDGQATTYSLAEVTRIQRATEGKAKRVLVERTKGSTDVLHLTDGRVIRGNIVGQIGPDSYVERVTIRTADGQTRTFEAWEIKRIEKGE